MGTKWHGLNRNKAPSKISKKRVLKMREETKTKREIRSRSNGNCVICELEPSAPMYKLEIHEIKFRSAGGKVSLENSIAVCSLCHWFLQRYTFRRNQEECIRIIRQWRNLPYQDALDIYNKIIQFCKEHEL
jgi:hypothetical protein